MNDWDESILNDLDAVDYALLTALGEADRPLWKKRLYEYLDDNQDRLPISDTVSMQTVGRRVDQLLADRYIDNLIIEPEESQRDMLIAFELTENGRTALGTYRQHLLRQVVKEELFPEEDGTNLSEDALLQIMQDYFEFDDGVEETLRQYDADELVTFLTIRYAQREAVDVLDQGHLDKYREILDEYPDVKQALEIQ